ncbi:MAG: hypothetical protein EOO92_10095 [Pedobacter sp.]|nr:MAG: hypothetical protein EOO92_10095 [Pedobacter sp.]
MSKKKRKSNKQTGKKATITAIKQRLVTELTSIVIEFGQESKKLSKEIEKRSAQLAKKLSKKIKLSEPTSPSESAVIAE